MRRFALGLLIGIALGLHVRTPTLREYHQAREIGRLTGRA